MKGVAFVSLYGVENNGVRILSSVVQAAGIPAYIVFFKRWTNNDIRPPSRAEYEILTTLLKDLGVSVVAISFTSPFVQIAREMTRRIKTSMSCSVVWGGIHASVSPQECLNDCDVVCRGEGELVIAELVMALETGKSLKGVRNIFYKDNGKIEIAPMAPLIQGLDSLPFQDYGGTNKFFIHERLERKDPLEYAVELRVFASRGCPFQCAYCYNSIFRSFYPGQQQHRTKKVQTVIKEISAALASLKRVKKIKFEDDTFVFPSHWIKEFCEQYPKQVNRPFEILFNAQCHTDEMFVRLKAAGLSRVQVGLQTGSPEESEGVYRRPMSLDKITALAYQLHRLRIDVVYDVIFDNPLISYRDNERMAEFLLTLPRPFDLFMYSLTVFPGTVMADTLLKRGVITADQVEGRAQKSFEQFRFSFSYPRSREELFIAAIVSLTSKSFVPRTVIRMLMRSSFFKKNVKGVVLFAEACNVVKLVAVFTRMLLRRELSWWKMTEYASTKKILIQ